MKKTIGLDLPLDLTRNRVDIDQFTRFEEKNSPMYGESISNLYTETKEFDNRTVFNTSGDKFHYLNGILYKNDEPIMETGGSKYFTRKTVNRDQYDTYDKDDEGNELYSKYENGVISYHADGVDYTFTATDPYSAIVDCRARIVNGTPIIAYILAQSTGNYEIVYLKRATQWHQSGISKNLKQSYLRTSQLLAENAYSGGSYNQNRDTGISINASTTANPNCNGFSNPLIQISNPLENVFVVSFITDHGGKLDPFKLGNFNVLDNNGTIYNDIQWNTSSGTVQVLQEEKMEASFKTQTSTTEETFLVYCYPSNSGWPQYDQSHADDIGKWFKTIQSDGESEWLADEVVFDPGYKPEYQSNTTDTYGSGTNVSSYTKYQVYSATTLSEKITINGSFTKPVGKSNAPVTVRWPYTPKLKTYNAGGDTYNGPNFSFDYIRALALSQKGINIPADFSLDANRWQFSNNATQVTPSVGDDIMLLATDPLIDVNQNGLPTRTFEVVEWDNPSQAATFNKASNIFREEEFHYTMAYDYYSGEVTSYCDINLVRAASGDVGRNKPVYYIDLYLNNPTAKRVEHKVIEIPDHEPVEYDQTIYTIRHVRLNVNTAMAGTVTFPTMPSVFGTYNIQPGTYNIGLYTPNSTTTNPPNRYTDTPRMFTVLEDPYITWTDGTVQYFETVLKGDNYFSWTYSYDGNSFEYEYDDLFEHFTNKATITYVAADTTADPRTQTDQTNNFGYEAQEINYIKNWEYTITQNVTQILTPNIFLDDGTAVSIGYPVRYYVLPVRNFLLLQARVTGITGNRFNFVSIGYYNTQGPSVEGCIMDCSIDLNMSYYRIMFHFTNKSISIDDTTSLMIMYDSATRDTYAYPGGLATDTTGSQWLTAHYYNNQGSIANQYGNWRATINSCGLVSGLSYGDNEYIGTLLTEWNSIAEDKYLYFTDKTIAYKSTDGNWYEIGINDGDGNINIIFDRYIIVNTDGFWNCYDIERGRQLHYATDFNNRVYAGVSQRDYNTSTSTGEFISIGKKASVGRDYATFFVAGINALYEVSQVAITSIQISPQAYLNIANGYESFCWCKADNRYTPQYIEVFVGADVNATSATYKYSINVFDKTSVSIVDSSLVGLTSPVAIAATTQYSPNIFTEFVHTYNNKDLVKNGSYGYPIIYNETTPILSYSSGKQVSNVDSIFVIQSQFYALIGGKIVSVTYDNYTIIGLDAIIDINGMVFLGYLPTAAYFWSPADRCIYTFTGDANLDIAMEANKINEVYKCYYSTMKEAIFITTDQGIYVITGKQQWHLDIVDVDNIYFLKDGYFVVESKKDNKYVCTYVSYEKDKLENPEKRKVVIETKYNGFGDGQVATTDRVQVVLICDEPEAGELLINSSTFTDVGFESEVKKYPITKDMWDKINRAIVFNYCPKYPTGQGFKFRLTSDFPVARMTQSIEEKKQGTSTKHNQ